MSRSLLCPGKTVDKRSSVWALTLMFFPHLWQLCINWKTSFPFHASPALCCFFTISTWLPVAMGWTQTLLLSGSPFLLIEPYTLLSQLPGYVCALLEPLGHWMTTFAHSLFLSLSSSWVWRFSHSLMFFPAPRDPNIVLSLIFYPAKRYLTYKLAPSVHIEEMNDQQMRVIVQIASFPEYPWAGDISQVSSLPSQFPIHALAQSLVLLPFLFAYALTSM